MTVLRGVRPFILALFASVLIFVCLIHLDDLATAASSFENSGLGRGQILDRNGSRLAWSQDVGKKTVRRYSEPALGLVTGFRTPSGKWTGLEALYNSFLSGAPMRRDWRTFFLHLTGAYVHGGNVRLTIDSRLQNVAASALGKSMGSVVALQPQTGDVLAMVSHPYCAPDLLDRSTYFASCSRSRQKPLLNRALNLLVPPGSAFKIVTLTAALDSGRFKLSDVFSGADAFGPSPFFDNSLYPSNVTRSDLTALTLKQALAFSDNFAFAHIGLTLGAQTLLKYAHLYLVGRHIPFELPTAPSVIANGSLRPTLSVLAQSAFGAATDQVTPLQMAMIASTVANGGIMMTPHVVRDLEQSGGHIIQRFHDQSFRRVMSKQAAKAVAEGMRFVVVHGSGFRAQISGINVAGKTGTAASSGNKPNAWFICFAPIQHPVVAVAILHEFSGEGFEYAAPIARKILVAALREHGYHVH